jgi:hypothetical protein
MFSVSEMIKCALAGGYMEDDVAALAAVTAVRTAAGNESLASKADAAAPPVAGLNRNGDFVDEFHAA